ncbi:ABC transporter ATP-binding protein [Bifidobacterium pullorum subsp. saeculare]|uniref:Fatty acid ABC transporter ATP-binding/permease protein n=1 Tax=Bifidobacterium pullorum subsp. saeculare TaxID=78257 RepID=A0A938WY24_9BIFI|nr:ABC transporter ATP-binding protein [Bifidobacterium pullorum]MBM6699374.1 ABC transporter ATP-binding protein [Bifidobacterium pullorum subsp. saeculare]
MTKKPRSHTLKRMVGYILEDKLRCVLVVLAATLATVCMVLGPKIMGQATNALFEGIISKMLGAMGIPADMPKDQIIEMMKQHGLDSMTGMVSSMDIHPGSGVDFGKVAVILGITGCVFLGTVLLRWLQGWTMTRLVTNAVYRMRRQIEDKLDRLPLNYFDRVPRGEVMSRTTNDVDNIGQTLQQVLGEFVFAVFTIIGVVVMMLTISPVLTLVSLIVIPVMLLVAYIIIRKSQPFFFRQWTATGEVNSHVEEMFTGHMVVRAYGQEEQTKQEFERRNAELYHSAFNAQFIAGLNQPATMFFSNLNFVIVVVVGGLKVLSGQMSLGDLQAFTQYSRQLSQPLGQLSSMATILQSSLASAERIFEFLDEPEEEPDPAHTKDIEDVKGLVKFDHVKFSYDPAEPLIEDLSLTAKPGQTVAIVGPTGAGKTTLVNLLMRFYEIQGGAITIDGVNTREMSRHDLRSHFGMVLQDTWLFDGTIRDNLVYGVREGKTISEERMLEGARATHVDEFVRRLPQGYDTELNDETSELSQGERQLMTICRAFLSDPDILILDEATSSVDTRTEVLVQNAMNELRKGRTSFVIAHRLSTIRDADLILVVNHGSIVEQGTHDELLAKGGAYADLYNSQFANGGAIDED